MKLHSVSIAILASSVCSMLPLKPGNTWTWQVSNRANLDLTYRTATVLDSHPVPEGSLWRLVAKDSSTGSCDTVSILVTADGRQRWLHRSSLLAWDLQASAPSPDSVLVVGEDTTSRWGEASLLAPGAHWASADTSLGRHGSSYGFDNGSTIQLFPTPFLDWADSLGLRKAVVCSSFHSRLDWRLTSHNGRDVGPAPDSLLLPQSGTEFVWRLEVHTTTRRIDSLVTWKIGDPLPDSAGWRGVKVMATRSACHRTLWIDDTNPDGTLAFGPCDIAPQNEIVVRLNPHTGQFLTSETVRSPFPESWLGHREEQESPVGSIATDRFWQNRRGMWNDVQSSAWLSRHGRLLQWSEYVYTDRWAEYDSTRTEYQLVKPLVEGDPLPSGVRKRQAHGLAMGLDRLARTFPALPIRWSTASGRTGTLMASEIVQRPVALRGKTLFLQARLPDGRMWQGTHMVP